ncbi:MAG: flagellar filament capping protein FliD [Campylobacterota bacterium]|nr:flagellar filament capping protein FliD [Campylobacterota bacterium]
MAGTINSLGIGSEVLTSDVIDKLKANDETVMVKPLETKLALTQQKQESAELLTSLMESFKSSASALSSSTLFDNKTVDIDGDAEVKVEAGALIESFTLETVELAQTSIIKLGSFNDRDTTPVASGTFTGTETLRVSIGTQSYDIAYDATTKLEDLMQSINDAASDTITATILQTGENAFSLVLTSKETGSDQAITLSDDGGLLDASLLGNMQEIQVARDATFKYNGIEATRSTNEISDLVTGVTMTLKKEGDISSVNIDQNTIGVVTEMQLFVDSYNNLMTNLHDMTTSDLDSGATGIFNSDSFVRSISRDIRDFINKTEIDGVSLDEFGIEIDRYAKMSFDSSVLQSKLDEDSNAVEMFFAGGVNATDSSEVTGFFEKLDDKMKGYTGYNALLSNFEDNLKTRYDNIFEDHAKAVETLDNRYEIMAKRFMAYDAIISKVNSQFSSLQMMIDAEANKN